MKYYKKQLLLIAFLPCALAASVHDFTVTMNGQRLFFNITSKANKTAEVTYNGSIADKHECDISGDVEIPSRVKHDNVIYTVTGIEAKTFANATKLKGITLPSDLTTIGDFAFEGCSSLEKIVFGSKSLKLGQGVFFKCAAIKNVSLGSDWKSVNLGIFRWSDSLTVISIPAKVEKVQNMKSLKHLQSIIVDANNSHFSSFDGVLYSKDGTTLYGCPRGYKNKLKIHEGTTSVSQGAFIDCPNITEVELPASLKTFSFREFSRMKDLKSVVFHSETPLTTAYQNGKGVFLLQIANTSVKLYVPNASKKTYKSDLVIKPGEYKETNEVNSIAFQVTDNELPQVKNIIGVKDFDTLK